MLRREAASWLVRLQSGRDPDIERKFRNWHDLDPAHAAAFGRVRESYERSAVLRHSGAVPARRALAETSPRLARYRWAAAAALALLMGGGLYIAAGGIFKPSGTEAVMLATKVGEIRQVRLADGTRLTLDTATNVEIEVGRTLRRAVITTGRARFDLTGGDTPFLIKAGNTTTTAGTGVFDVETFDGASAVDVLAGHAVVRSATQAHGNPVTLAAGEGAIAAPGAPLKRYPVAHSNWIRGMLQFDATPLPAAVALANRYSKQKIILEPGLGQFRVTGAFRTGDLAGLATA